MLHIGTVSLDESERWVELWRCASAGVVGHVHLCNVSGDAYVVGADAEVDLAVARALGDGEMRDPGRDELLAVRIPLPLGAEDRRLAGLGVGYGDALMARASVAGAVNVAWTVREVAS